MYKMCLNYYEDDSYTSNDQRNAILLTRTNGQFIINNGVIDWIIWIIAIFCFN